MTRAAIGIPEAGSFGHGTAAASRFNEAVGDRHTARSWGEFVERSSRKRRYCEMHGSKQRRRGLSVGLACEFIPE